MEAGSEDGSSQDLPPLGDSTDQAGTGTRGYPGCHGGARWMNEWILNVHQNESCPLDLDRYIAMLIIVIMPDFQYCH